MHLPCIYLASHLHHRISLPYLATTGGNLGGSGINYPLRGGKYTFWQGGVRGNSFLAGGLIPPARRGTVWEGTRCAPFNLTTMGVNSVSPARLHVRPMGARSTRR